MRSSAWRRCKAVSVPINSCADHLCSLRPNHPSAPLLWPTLRCSGFFFAGMVRVVGCMKSVLTVCVWTMWLPTDLLKNKSRPEHAANEAVAWVESERAMREKLKKEREARELKEKQEVSYPITYPIHIDYRALAFPGARLHGRPALVCVVPRRLISSVPVAHTLFPLLTLFSRPIARRTEEGAAQEGEGGRRTQEARRGRGCTQGRRAGRCPPHPDCSRSSPASSRSCRRGAGAAGSGSRGRQGELDC